MRYAVYFTRPDSSMVHLYSIELTQRMASTVRYAISLRQDVYESWTEEIA